MNLLLILTSVAAFVIAIGIAMELWEDRKIEREAREREVRERFEPSPPRHGLEGKDA
jgi:hypothetical protein